MQAAELDNEIAIQFPVDVCADVRIGVVVKEDEEGEVENYRLVDRQAALNALPKGSHGSVRIQLWNGDVLYLLHSFCCGGQEGPYREAVLTLEDASHDDSCCQLITRPNRCEAGDLTALRDVLR